MICRIDRALLGEVAHAAAAHPRRRKNWNFHPSDDYPGHRLLNAMEPDSYIPPHRHLDPNKDETLVCLKGRLGIVVFNEDGSVADTEVASFSGEVLGFDIPHGTFHSIVALEPGTVFLEAKSGPYLPLSPEEKAPWAPPEGAPEAALYLEDLRKRFTSTLPEGS